MDDQDFFFLQQNPSLDEQGLEWLNERAAILEYEAGMTRRDAEEAAWQEWVDE